LPLVTPGWIGVFGVYVVPAVLVSVLVQPPVLIEAEKFAFLRKIIAHGARGFGIRNDAEMMLFVAVAAETDTGIDELSEMGHCFRHCPTGESARLNIGWFWSAFATGTKTST